jgi:curved DNA-binding protein CbpA
MMESKREEAFRARQIASKKMENKDFIGAQNMVLKAQQLFPELDNVSQILTTCKVHCAADARVNVVMDWYAILQVDAGADEAMIKKQYRKLALSLHPDKNSFAGGEAAFKLVAEAHSELCDRERRSQYDIKRRSGSRSVARSRQSKTTFWTACPNCQVPNHYNSYIFNSTVRCGQWQKNFFVYHLKEHHVPISSNVPNGSGVPTNMFPNQQSDSSSQQGHLMQPSSEGGGTHVKPNGPQVHANIFELVKLSSAGGGTYAKLRVNVTQDDELMKGYSRPVSDGKANKSEMSRGQFQLSTLNQGKSRHHNFAHRYSKGNSNTHREKKADAHGRSVSDPADINIVDGKNFGMKVASTVSSAAGSSYLRGLVRWKQHASGGIDLSSDNKRQRTHELPADVDMATPDPAGPNIVDRQKSVREDPSAAPDVMNAPAFAKPSSAGGKGDGKLRVNFANGYTKGNSNTTQEKKANAHGRSVPDPADINIVDGKNFGTNVASTMSSAAGSSYLRRSRRRKQHAGGDIDLSSDNKIWEISARSC